ncbi:hypothetical protein Bbelb_003450 [Branchiostoma belcheri]|nr:hypothetical protein Bbelb_003450 [Branchiostoma belcheri]
MDKAALLPDTYLFVLVPLIVAAFITESAGGKSESGVPSITYCPSHPDSQWESNIKYSFFPRCHGNTSKWKKGLCAVPEGEDDLKKRQLMELAILNGTYRDNNTKNMTSSLPSDLALTAPSLYAFAGTDQKAGLTLYSPRGVPAPNTPMVAPPTAVRSPMPAGAPLIATPSCSGYLRPSRSCPTGSSRTWCLPSPTSCTRLTTTPTPCLPHPFCSTPSSPAKR